MIEKATEFRRFSLLNIILPLQNTKIMEPKYAFLLTILSMIFCATYGCKYQEPTPAEELYADFQSIAPLDTLPIPLDTVGADTGRAISPQHFLAALDSILIETMIYEPDTFDFQGRAYWKIPLDEETEACLLDIKQGWFKFKYLLLYSKSTKSFVNLIPAAYFYGGDGGQILSESYLFDLNTTPTLFTSYYEHYLRLSSNEPENIERRSMGLRQWSGGAFQEVPVRDSSVWQARYRIDWW